jgi:cobalamin biosynthesis protein CobD/CbiB
MHVFNFILALFSFVLVCRDLVASRRRQQIVFGRQRLKRIVRRDEQDCEARRVGGRTCSLRSPVMLTFAEGSRQGYFFGFAFFTVDLLALLTAQRGHAWEGGRWAKFDV